MSDKARRRRGYDCGNTGGPSGDANLGSTPAAEDSGASGKLKVVVMVTDVELTSMCARYDVNQNEAIDRDEAVRAVVNYFSGDIDKEDVLEVIQLYLAG